MDKFLIGCFLLVSSAVLADALPRAVIVKESVDGLSLAQKAASAVKAAGYAVETVEPWNLEEALKQSAELLVISDGALLPASAGKPIRLYRQSGGKLIALRAPLWQTPLVKHRDKWISVDDYHKQTAVELPRQILFDFRPGSIEDWQRQTNDAQFSSSFRDGLPGPAPGSHALHARITNLTGWDILCKSDLAKPFPDGHTLTVFAAKGGSRTSQLAVEWVEEDGSRWIATVAIDQNWRRYVLMPEDFKYWISNPKRGGGADKFNPNSAKKMAFGVAFSHGAVEGENEFWVGSVGTSDAESEAAFLLSKPDIGPMDLLHPKYKFFESTEVAQVVLQDGKQIPAHGRLLSPHPRPEGRGFGKGRDWRFVTLATARTAKGEWRGIPAAMMLHAPDSAWKGGVWACFGFQDEAAYDQPDVLSLIREVAERMRNGAFLLEAGTNFFTCFEDEPLTFGTEILNLGLSEIQTLEVNQKLVEAGSGKIVWSKAQTIDSHKGQREKVSTEVQLQSINGGFTWPQGGLTAVTTLLRDGIIVDEITHEVNVWKPKQNKQFMTVGQGQFLLNGKPWKAHGVNYMPSSGIGTEDWPYFEHWMGARAYDPEIIQRDLVKIKELGLNSVSIFTYHQDRLTGNLLDILRRCEGLDLKVNLSLRPGTPMDFPWDNVKEIIERYRLWDNDTVIAYDLAWEPSFGGHEERKQYDQEWAEWIKKRYGSVENAEAEWGHPVPRNNEKITNPSDNLLVTDGEWRKMVAAYRHFVDELLYRNYNRARTLVRTVDPNHLVSFRMSEAGNPTFNWVKFLPYDFPGLADAVDFLAPEAYSRIGVDWNIVRPWWFQREYARWAAPDKPMIWSEVGVNTWDNARMMNTEEKLQFQADYFELFYKMMIDSRANGVYWWWYPGGFRCFENSDYGIINPDGSDRPSSKVIRNNAKAFLDALDQPEINVWIDIDRDADARGLFAIYEKAEEAFWKYIEEGRKPGLKSAEKKHTGNSK